MFTSRKPNNTELHPFIESLCIGKSSFAHDFELILPIPNVQLLVNLHKDEFSDYDLEQRPQYQGKGACVIGPARLAKLIHTKDQAHICGIKFRIGGFYGLFGTPVRTLTDQVVDVRNIWSEDALTLRPSILTKSTNRQKFDELEAFIMTHKRKDSGINPEILTAIDEIESGRDIKALSVANEMSARELIAMFRKYTGLSPKMMSRLLRFQNLVKAIDEGQKWSDRAFQHGFSDQSHMIREFRRFSGITPTAYRMRSSDARNHMAADEL